MVKLNLGCGNEHLKGYINIDIVPTPATDMVMDCLHLGFKNNSVNKIVAYHLIEHLTIKEFNKAKREWWRVLKVGGKLVLECPDLEEVTRLFSESDFDSRWVVYNNGPPLIRHIYGGQVNPYEFHKSGYSKWLLVRLLGKLYKNFSFGESHKDYRIPCIHLECVKRRL